MFAKTDPSAVVALILLCSHLKYMKLCGKIFFYKKKQAKKSNTDT